MPDAVDELALQSVGRHGEDQHAHARTPVRRLARIDLAIDASFGAATDDGRGKAGHGRRGLTRPFLIRRGNQDRGAAHRKGFGEGLVDPHAILDYGTHATSSKACSRGVTACSRTLNTSRDMP